jgi:hypothetical protein
MLKGKRGKLPQVLARWLHEVKRILRLLWWMTIVAERRVGVYDEPKANGYQVKDLTGFALYPKLLDRLLKPNGRLLDVERPYLENFEDAIWNLLDTLSLHNTIKWMLRNELLAHKHLTPVMLRFGGSNVALVIDKKISEITGMETYKVSLRV